MKMGCVAEPLAPSPLDALRSLDGMFRMAVSGKGRKAKEAGRLGSDTAGQTASDLQVTCPMCLPSKQPVY